ncbi:hypothetical protein GXM_02659 [Nostoc sphaeroides CCNUC1]|uniref:Uncharacterized protein n=1 Tax=Nostoc sphaeroides CCNUC1 TaxID=2653204 RepID=A0A5P8VXP6_9NOSO|nr:hypothetical protein GXM_02659 [Nostoc sphaeroides CCNUC1]
MRAFAQRLVEKRSNPSPQYSSVKPKNLGKDAKFRVSTGLKLVPKILN